MAHYRVDVEEVVPTVTVGGDQAAAAPALAVARPVYDWEATNQRKVDAVQQLAALADALDDIEACIDELIARTKDLVLNGSAGADCGQRCTPHRSPVIKTPYISRSLGYLQ